MLLWVVVPAFNEAPNLRDLVPRTLAVLAGLPGETRLLLVDDGSSDGSAQVMRALAAEHAGVEVEILRHNRGKAAALREGFERACEAGADVVAMMDADGQDDPAELPRLLARLGEGADLVTGARLERNDRFVKRTTSRLYNAVTRRFSGTPGRDFNSGLKLMRREVALDVLPMLYGEMHRYLTVVAHAQGHRVDEVPVRHHARMSGTSKYGPSRFWRGFADLVTVRFLLAYENRPSHLFGAIGGLCLLLGGALLAYLTGLKAATGAVIGDRPLLLAGVLLVMVGLQLLLFGLLAELVVHARQTGQRRGVEPGDAQLRRVVAEPVVAAEPVGAAAPVATGRAPAPGVHG